VRGADLWLLNPAGILFGPRTRLDVPGSFHASTADELRFADGKVFSALDAGGSVLSVAEPQAFGFLGAKPPGPIKVDRSILEVKQGKSLSLIGGDITVRGSSDGIVNEEFTQEPGTVRAKAGRVSLMALGGPGTVRAGTKEATGAVTGEIHLSDEASVIASGNGGGTIHIRGGRLVAKGNSHVSANNIGRSDATDGVVIEAENVMVIDTSLVTAYTDGIGTAGAVTLRTGMLKLHNGSWITSATFGPGNAGTVTVQADTLKLHGSTTINSNAFGPGNAGAVTLRAGVLELDDSWISSETFGPGNAGAVTLRTGMLKLHNGGWISSETFGPGNAGAVTLRTGMLKLHNGGWISSNTFGPGNAGAVTVQADTLKLHDGFISTISGLGPGNAGAVTLRAGVLELDDRGWISSQTFGPGNAGQVSIAASSVTVANGGEVQTSSEEGSGAAGAAGNVSVRASRLMVRDGGLISSSGAGTGPAGNLQLEVGTLEVENASIRTEGKVREGGRIGVIASDLIHLEDAEVTSSGIQPEVGASVITLEAPLIALNDSQVTSLTGAGEPLAGSGLAQLLGEVTVISSDSFVAASSSVTLTGTEGNVGSRLAVPEGTFLNIGDLLRESCAARRSGKASSFTAMGRSGRSPDPAGPLAGFYREPGGTTGADQAGPVLAANFGEGCRAAPGG
jgi:large exoprotein involved in heme utilization and adhesion